MMKFSIMNIQISDNYKYDYRFSIIIQVFIFLVLKPPTQPSPTGEGVCNDLFPPLGEIRKGVK